jgi:hypothetical protein
MEHSSKAAVRDPALDAAADGGLPGGGAAPDWAIAAVVPPAARGPQPVPAEVGCDTSERGSPLGWPLARSASGSGSGSGSYSELGGGGGQAAAAAEALQRQLEEARLQQRREAAAAAEREARWRQQAEGLQARVAQLQQQQAAQQQQQQQQPPGGGQAAALTAQCDALSRERDALRTILDSKVRVLVEDVGRSVAELPSEVSRQHACPLACAASGEALE